MCVKPEPPGSNLSSIAAGRIIANTPREVELLVGFLRPNVFVYLVDVGKRGLACAARVKIYYMPLDYIKGTWRVESELCEAGDGERPPLL